MDQGINGLLDQWIGGINGRRPKLSATFAVVAVAALRPVRRPAQRRGGGILRIAAGSRKPNGLWPARQRLECGAFTAALARTERYNRSGNLRAHESGAEATALQTLARWPSG